ncbi:hypothetical protein Halru_0224 [Halovivax ruber XH-70]|uniref:Uncharacterized protein n=1 Tax=Halovivax ruber (strain DSM 18193 / JCM 13892 / XH-70) TaxID=797302 RepID=L0I5S9_HALRX|nr:hypothetical protein [Halovivax ruber]AGB14870.1 hypothetical protein Halru_0224 [Halovivax ruber XH-70]
METEIIGEDEDDIGVKVVDQKGAEHQIELHKGNGDIYAHVCDEYADKAANRTPEENEVNEQARRFAQYYVYCERGYDTVPPEVHPERIDAVRQAIAELSQSAFDDRFGDLRQQLRSYHDDSVSRAIPIPSDAAGSDLVLYRQHVYLGLDPLETDLADEFETLATVHEIDLDETSEPVAVFNDSKCSDWRAFSEHAESLAQNRDVDISDAIDIGGVSSLYTAYVDDHGVEHIGEPNQDPFDRDPDTLIELAPIDPGPLQEFQAYVDHYLKCQIRDCFVRMGLHPPEEFCVLGPGRIEAAEQYKTLEMYPDFTDPDNRALLASN